MKDTLTVKDLEKALQQVVQDISDIEDARWKDNDEKWKNNQERLDKLFIGQDRMIKLLENLEGENEIGTDQTRELRVDVDSHEKRITTLEHSKN